MTDKIFNRPEYTSRRQDLRKNATQPEQKLWAVLRGKQLGVKFRRQHGIDHYIVDFYCPEAKLVIEVDGAAIIRTQPNNKTYSGMPIYGLWACGCYDLPIRTLTRIWLVCLKRLSELLMIDNPPSQPPPFQGEAL